MSAREIRNRPIQPERQRGGSPIRVLIAGGGVAGLETLTALRALADRRVELALVAPQDEFVYRPLAIKEPFAVGRIRRIPLHDVARDANASFVVGAIEAVDPVKKSVSLCERQTLEYDALVLAVGATAAPAVAGAMTWDDHSDVELLGGLLQDFEQGYSRRLAVVIPPGASWPLRAYELALLIALEGRGMGIDVDATIVTPEPSPLSILGPRASEAISRELDLASISVVSSPSARVERHHAAAVVLEPSGRRLEVDRVLALPSLKGRPIAGIPVDDNTFIEVDEHGRVPGLDAIWAAGDVTAFPLKSGGIASEQADVAAEDIAAVAGAAIDPRPFDPVGREALAGLPAGRFLESWLGAGEDGLTTHLPASGLPLLKYLQRDLQAGRRSDV